jgi:hypothetical protein
LVVKCGVAACAAADDTSRIAAASSGARSDLTFKLIFSRSPVLVSGLMRTAHDASSAHRPSKQQPRGTANVAPEPSLGRCEAYGRDARKGSGDSSAIYLIY